MTHEIVVLALNDVVVFDLGVSSQIFGSARDADGRRLYRVRTCTPDGEPVRTSAGFLAMPDVGPEVLDTADTVIVAGVHGGMALTEGRLEPAVAGALARTRPGVEADVDLYGSVRPGRGGPARRPSRRHALAARRPVPRAVPAGAAGRRRPVRRRRRRADLGGRRRGHRPVPARDPPRPRQRGGQPRRPPLGGAALARRRPVPVHRPPVAGPDGHVDGGHPDLGADPPARAAGPSAAGPSGGDERTDVHPPLPRGDRA